MRRSICYCEPKVALAGASNTWRFTYIPANSLPAKTKLLFKMDTEGRSIDWEIPQTDLKKGKNVIWMTLPDEKKLSATCVGDSFNPAQYEFTLSSDVEEGEQIVIHMGDPSDAPNPDNGNKAQTYIQRRRAFTLYIDPKGKRDYKESEPFHIDVKGNTLYNIKIIAPSIVSKNQRFDVIVRFEDCYGNLTGNAEPNSLIELSYEQLRDNLSWKLFVPETGFITLPNLYFNELGIYKFKLKNTSNGNLYFSAPIKCFQETPNQVFWGLLHGEAEKYNMTDTVESALRHFRDDYSFQFYASSSSESEDNTKNEHWKMISNQIADFNEDERFITMLGFQWTGSIPSEGVRHIVYAKDNKAILRKRDSKSNSIKKIYKSHSPKELIAIPCFTMGKGLHYNFESYTPEFERVIEIYNAWGSSECLESEGNLRPIKSNSNVTETKDGSIRQALNQNLRFGFVAGGLDDRGVYENFYSSDQVQYSPGLTAIVATEHTREALIQALYNRSCYATTGPRIVVSFFVAGAGMGSELCLVNKPGLQYNRHISGCIAGTSDLEEIQIIRNGSLLHSFKPKDTYYHELTFDDATPFDQITLTPPIEGQSPFAYYYIRVIQKDGHIAWGSPVWIDLVAPKLNESNNKKAP
ncbi:MAG: DUF3604 domain-containing protein [Simkaniaceae bacterium]|nr:DUF3604 domain-containing protein [Simkaniaceae bacterium]MCF7853074.1 DUF3604 domain-containing protein [Simkaniaceae bacterium]